MEQKEPPTSQLPPHFKGKEAVEHVIEAQTQGIVSAAEIHGEEAPAIFLPVPMPLVKWLWSFFCFGFFFQTFL